jgi:hypothetical protein
VKRSEAVLLVLAVFAGLAVRLYFFTGMIASDDLTHALHAAHACGARSEAEFGVVMAQSVNGRRIGFNLPLALSITAFGVREWALSLVPLLFSLGGVLVAYGLLATLANRQAGLLAAWLWACLPIDVYQATIWLQDNVFATVLALFWWGMAASERAARRKWVYALLAGMALGYLEYVKEIAYLCLAPLAIWAVYSSWKHKCIDWRILFVVVGFVVVQVLAGWYFWWEGSGALAFWRLTLARYLYIYEHLDLPRPFPTNLGMAWGYLTGSWVFGYAIVVFPLLALLALLDRRTPLRFLFLLLTGLQVVIVLEALKLGSWTQRYMLQVSVPFVVFSVLGVRALLRRLPERWDRRLMPVAALALVLATGLSLRKEWQQHGRDRADVVRRAFAYVDACAADDEKIYVDVPRRDVVIPYYTKPAFEVLAGCQPFKGGLTGIAHAYDAQDGWVVITHLEQGHMPLRKDPTYRGIAANWLEAFSTEDRNGRCFARVFRILPAEPPPWLRVIAKPAYPADVPYVPDRLFEPVHFDREPGGYLSNKWHKGIGGAEVTREGDGLRCELLPGPVGEDPHYGGVHFEVNGMRAVRLDLELLESEHVEVLYVYIYGSERGQLLRYQWSLRSTQRRRGVSGSFTLVPSRPSGYFRASGEIPPEQIRDVHVFVRLQKGKSAGLVLRRAEIVPDAAASQPIGGSAQHP